MPRKTRFFLPGVPVHVVQRGNNRQPVFFDPDDYRFYLERLREASLAHGCRVHAYCQMTNHIHPRTIPGRAIVPMPWARRTTFCLIIRSISPWARRHRSG